MAVTPKQAKTQAMIDDVLEIYPEKARKDRVKHVKPNDPDGSKECMVKSNIKSRPGVMTIRGCAYAGSKGVVWGPIKDMVHLSHGPVGCGQYSWGTRRNYFEGTLGVDSFVAMQFTSDFAERDIVFGGDKKLAKLCEEVAELFPLAKGISIQSECPIGLVGQSPAGAPMNWACRSSRCAAKASAGSASRWVITSQTTRSATGCSAPATQLSRRPTASPSSVTTTSAVTPGRRAGSSRTWDCE